MNIPDIVIFLGRFHPLVVHLPIGFLLLAFLMWAYSVWKKSNAFEQAIAFSLLLGTASAAAACVIGYMLSLSGGYEGEALDWHMWAGIATTVLAGLAYFLFVFKMEEKRVNHFRLVSFSGLVLVLSATGHLGGNLTHGSEYLIEYAPIVGTRAQAPEPPASMEQVMVYDHLVRPILQDKCISCHRSDKKKGGLSFSDKDAIRAGGESGSLFITDSQKESEMVRRILLSADHDDVMPPKGKTPLTEDEVTLLKFWSRHGAGFEELLAMQPTDSVYNPAARYLGFVSSGTAGGDMAALAEVDSLVIAGLRQAGISIRELAAGSYKYDVTLHTPDPIAKAEQLQLLSSIAPNVVWLSASQVALNDEELKHFNGMNNLKKLKLDNNELTDAAILSLSTLPNLQVLNIYGNPLTNACLSSFEKFEKLEKVYAWHTQITEAPTTRVKLYQ